MFGIGIQELLVILVIVLLIFGGKALPQLGTSFGRTIANFKKGLAEKDVIDVKAQDKSTDDH